MRTKNDKLELSSTDMTSTITSEPIWLGHIVNYSIQTVATGTPNGNFKLQGSNDEGARETNLASASIVNWSDLPNTTVTVTAAGSQIQNIENVGYRWVRLIWEDTSSGSPSTITSARYNLKGI